MRMGELLRSEVVAADGVSLGRVEDVRLVQDGPFVEGFGAALRLDALIVGRPAFPVRLGFHRHGVRGPAVLRWVFAAMERRGHRVPWSQVAACEGGTVRLRVPADQVPHLGDDVDG